MLESISHIALVVKDPARARSHRALYFFDYDDHVFELDTEDIDAELGG